MTLDKQNARAFNYSLKKAVSTLINQKVTVRIINSYKFPDCYIEVIPETDFNNEFRLKAFDTFGNDRKGLVNVNDVNYGNIQKSSITGKVFQWENLFNSL